MQRTRIELMAEYVQLANLIEDLSYRDYGYASMRKTLENQQSAVYAALIALPSE